MTTKPAPPPPPCPPWQEERRLSSGDRIWIFTDIETFTSALYHWSAEQRFFKVGAYDLRTRCIGFFKFTRDDAKGLLRAGLLPPPWSAPQSHGFEVTRLAHDGGQAKGRFVVTVKLLDIDPALHAIIPAAKRAFWHAAHHPNAKPDMWKDLVDAVAHEKRIETAALGMTGLFSASDVQAIVGVGVNVLPVLKRMVEPERRLERFGRTRGTKYRVR